jgi:hypothetical protein
MTSNPRRNILAFALAWAASPVSRAAGFSAFSAEETRSLRGTVQAQLTAFASGDYMRAYALATVAIQQQFGDAERFLAMVRSAYPMLINPGSVAFRLPERVEADASSAIQAVQLRDRNGKYWLATYQLDKQNEGVWRIAGCVVVADSSRLRT